MIRKIVRMFLMSLIALSMLVVVEFHVKAYGLDSSEVDLVHRLESLDKDVPPIKGGPEKTRRQDEDPIPLTTLQLQYPDTVFLQGPTTENKVALTFDDGPDPRFTPSVLDVLQEYDVPATFFLLGSRAEAYPDLTTRILNEGHVIGNHTFWHPDLVEEGEIDILVREVETTEATLESIIGYQTTLFRPPYGFLYDELVDELINLKYSIIGWSVDSLDWQEISPDEIISNIYDQMQPGAIVLMHDGTDAEGDQTETIEALQQLIPELQEQGYEFVTVPNLLNIPYQR
ncbi:polysaccharide deacetylase family protein [Salipaludibacillus daqingensis]|uniref:polysaccharide deacetylase family protein n=1 Tax=Salipaludibacillus daqingensis TaxID=3041001 RepID=UPI00247313B6|nr:polysaccharide deacetylase family protein [Salipaludibacillus daqingensis]